MSAAATRRGLLRLFAAAPIAAATASTLVLPAAEANWMTKPVEQWTKADFLAEARHHIASAHDRLAANPQSVGAAFAIEWWTKELVRIEAGGALA